MTDTYDPELVAEFVRFPGKTVHHDTDNISIKDSLRPSAKINDAAAVAITPELGLQEWDAGDDIEPPPPRGWLLGNAFCRNFMSSLLGDGGVGKTAVRYAQALSLASNRPLTGEHVFQRSRVLIVSLEDNSTELRRRILAARKHHGIELADIKGWLFLSAPGRSAGKIMASDKKGNAVLGKLAAHLEAVIVARKIDLVMLDPFVKSHSVEENHNSGIDEVCQVLTDLAAKYDIGVDAPHHTSKGVAEPGNASRGRGASAMADAGRLVYTLSIMSPEDAKTFSIKEDERKYYVRVDSAKVNITKPGGVAKWFRLIGVKLGNATEIYPNGDDIQTIEPWKPPETWADIDTALANQILTAIDAGLPDGNRYTDTRNSGTRMAWRVVVVHAPHKNEMQAREIIKSWVDNGVLEKHDYTNPATRKPANGFHLNVTKRPG
jgi:AAA domain